MKNDRLFQIVNLLIRRKSVTAPELAEEFGVSVRTIYRDIETLSFSGIPVYTTAGKNGGIQIMEEYKLEKAMLTDEEQVMLLQSMQNLQLMGQGNNKLWTKLSALFQKDIKPWIAVDFTRWGGEEGEDIAKFELLKHAALVKQVVFIQYCGTGDSAVEREICPIQLVYKSKDWYIYAFCRYRKDYRIFKLNRILKIREKEEYFEDNTEHIWKPEKRTEEGEEIVLKLLFSKQVGYRVYDDFAVKAVTRQEDGSFLVETKVPDGDWLYGYLLSYENEVKVLEPASVRQKLLKRLDQLRNKYSN